MTELESKFREGGADAVAPALVVAALPPSLMSGVDALRAACIDVVPTSSLEETRSAAAINPDAILLLGYPIQSATAEWLAGCRPKSAAARAPVLLLCVSDRLEEASASPVGDLALAADAPQNVLVQSVRLLLRLASSERAHDATARTRRQALDHRAEKMDSLGRVVGGMAHEFNNLLTVILGYSDLSIRLAAADSRFGDALLQIKNSAERGAHLTQLLLAFGRKQVMVPVWIDLNHLLFDLEEHIRLIVGGGVKIELQLAPSLPRIFVDPMLVQRALVQIVTNARDVMPEHGALRLTTSESEVIGGFASGRPELQPGRYVCLSIHDNGPGIPSDIEPFVFEPFFTTKSFGRGIGMGLAFVDGVMNQSGGGVDVVCEPGEGATFRLFFATVSGAPGTPATPATPAVALPPTNAGILLVDDDEGVRKFAGLVLRGRGYQVLEACDGAEALVLVDQNVSTIDLVVTDVFMPVMGGVELGNRLALLHPRLPILYQSGRLEDMRQTAGSEERNLHFLTKPFSREALLAKVSQLVRR